MATHDPYEALRCAGFRRYLVGNVVATVGQGMQTVAVGWELYERTDSAFALGLVGLVQVLPIFGLALIAGAAADRFDRKRIVLAALGLLGVSAVGLAIASTQHAPLVTIYALLFLGGIARAFLGPAKSALLPQVVPTGVFRNAVTWYSGGWQGAEVLGPAIGGAVIGLTQAAAPAYLLNGLAAGCFIVLLATVPCRSIAHPETTHRERRRDVLLAGVRYVGRTKVLLGALTLDLLAVLLGGTTAILPVFARDILHVGPVGLGWLLAAPSLGAVSMAVALAHRPPFERTGRALLMAVAGFGVSILLFGVSTSFLFSLLLLVSAGAWDSVSVVIRAALVQLGTPEAMRGRVSAVNTLFIDTSNELGAFESGTAAALVGPELAVVIGGIGTMGAVAFAMRRWPELRKLGRLVEN